jgi:flagellar protein FlaJ
MLMLIALFPAMFATVTYQLILSYPSMVASERGRKIDAALPHTTGFMHALSRSGVTIANIFRELSIRPDVGEIQKEAQNFRRDVEYLGHDPLTALRDLARTTPSKKFKGFIDVLVSIIETGGETTPYFSTKCIEFQNVLKEENKKTIASLELLAELYVILIAFLPLLFIAIFLFIGFMPGQSVDIRFLQVLAYGWIPMGSIAFAIIVSTTSPMRIGKARVLELPLPYKSVPLMKGDKMDTALLRRLRGAFWQMKVKRFLSNPFRAFVQTPSYVLFFSGPATVIYLFFTPIKTATLFIAFSIAFIPYIIAYEFRSRKGSQIERALPDFLKSLSSASRSGLTLPRAIAVTSTAEFGPLTTEIRRTRADTQWGASASEGLGRMEQRVAVSDVAARTITLIRKASEAEEDVSDVVDIALNDVEVKQTVAKERSMAMFVYKLIIIVTFAVFLVTVYFIVSSYLSLPVGVTEIGEAKISGVNPSDVKLLFYRVLLLQGMFSGLIAGQMGGGDMRSGLKLSIAMCVITILMFEFVLMPMGPRPITPPE